MSELREYATCIECGSPVVRIRHHDEGPLNLIHSFPDSEAALLCVLNPDALPRLHARDPQRLE